jgi:hypothetical protein
MPDIDDVLADAQREIKSIGDNVKSLKDNMEKNLADVRSSPRTPPRPSPPPSSSRRTWRR